MLSLSACSTSSVPTPESSVTSTPAESEVLVIDPTDGPVIEETEETPLARETPEHEYIATYPIPAPGEVTSIGEPIEDAEARFLEVVKSKAQNGETDAEILNLGYASCGLMSEVVTDAELAENAKVFSAGNPKVETLIMIASETASTTICPEFSDFGDPVIESDIPTEEAMG